MILIPFYLMSSGLISVTYIPSVSGIPKFSALTRMRVGSNSRQNLVWNVMKRLLATNSAQTATTALPNSLNSYWEPWNEWSLCFKWSRSRKRRCRRLQDQNCQGPGEETEECHVQQPPIDTLNSSPVMAPSTQESFLPATPLPVVSRVFENRHPRNRNAQMPQQQHQELSEVRISVPVRDENSFRQLIDIVSSIQIIIKNDSSAETERHVSDSGARFLPRSQENPQRSWTVSLDKWLGNRGQLPPDIPRRNSSRNFFNGINKDEKAGMVKMLHGLMETMHLETDQPWAISADRLKLAKKVHLESMSRQEKIAMSKNAQHVLAGLSTKEAWELPMKAILGPDSVQQIKSKEPSPVIAVDKAIVAADNLLKTLKKMPARKPWKVEIVPSKTPIRISTIEPIYFGPQRHTTTEAPVREIPDFWAEWNQRHANKKVVAASDRRKHSHSDNRRQQTVESVPAISQVSQRNIQPQSASPGTSIHDRNSHPSHSNSGSIVGRPIFDNEPGKEELDRYSFRSSGSKGRITGRPIYSSPNSRRTQDSKVHNSFKETDNGELLHSGEVSLRHIGGRPLFPNDLNHRSNQGHSSRIGGRPIFDNHYGASKTHNNRNTGQRRDSSRRRFKETRIDSPDSSRIGGRPVFPENSKLPHESAQTKVSSPSHREDLSLNRFSRPELASDNLNSGSTRIGGRPIFNARDRASAKSTADNTAQQQFSNEARSSTFPARRRSKQSRAEPSKNALIRGRPIFPDASNTIDRRSETRNTGRITGRPIYSNSNQAETRSQSQFKSLNSEQAPIPDSDRFDSISGSRNEHSRFQISSNKHRGGEIGGSPIFPVQSARNHLTDRQSIGVGHKQKPKNQADWFLPYLEQPNDPPLSQESEAANIGGRPIFQSERETETFRTRHVEEESNDKKQIGGRPIFTEDQQKRRRPEESRIQFDSHEFLPGGTRHQSIFSRKRTEPSALISGRPVFDKTENSEIEQSSSSSSIQGQPRQNSRLNPREPVEPPSRIEGRPLFSTKRHKDLEPTDIRRFGVSESAPTSLRALVKTSEEETQVSSQAHSPHSKRSPAANSEELKKLSAKETDLQMQKILDLLADLQDRSNSKINYQVSKGDGLNLKSIGIVPPFHGTARGSQPSPSSLSQGSSHFQGLPTPAPRTAIRNIAAPQNYQGQSYGDSNFQSPSPISGPPSMKPPEHINPAVVPPSHHNYGPQSYPSAQPAQTVAPFQSPSPIRQPSPVVPQAVPQATRGPPAAVVTRPPPVFPGRPTFPGQVNPVRQAGIASPSLQSQQAPLSRSPGAAQIRRFQPQAPPVQFGTIPLNRNEGSPQRVEPLNRNIGFQSPAPLDSATKIQPAPVKVVGSYIPSHLPPRPTHDYYNPTTTAPPVIRPIVANRYPSQPASFNGQRLLNPTNPYPTPRPEVKSPAPARGSYPQVNRYPAPRNPPIAFPTPVPPRQQPSSPVVWQPAQRSAPGPPAAGPPAYGAPSRISPHSPSINSPTPLAQPYANTPSKHKEFTVTRNGEKYIILVPDTSPPGYGAAPSTTAPLARTSTPPATLAPSPVSIYGNRQIKLPSSIPSMPNYIRSPSQANINPINSNPPSSTNIRPPSRSDVPPSLPTHTGYMPSQHRGAVRPIGASPYGSAPSSLPYGPPAAVPPTRVVRRGFHSPAPRRRPGYLGGVFRPPAPVSRSAYAGSRGGFRPPSPYGSALLPPSPAHAYQTPPIPVPDPSTTMPSTTTRTTTTGKKTTSLSDSGYKVKEKSSEAAEPKFTPPSHDDSFAVRPVLMMHRGSSRISNLVPPANSSPTGSQRSSKPKSPSSYLPSIPAWPTDNAPAPAPSPSSVPSKPAAIEQDAADEWVRRGPIASPTRPTPKSNSARTNNPIRSWHGSGSQQNRVPETEEPKTIETKPSSQPTDNSGGWDRYSQVQRGPLGSMSSPRSPSGPTPSLSSIPSINTQFAPSQRPQAPGMVVPPVLGPGSLPNAPAFSAHYPKPGVRPIAPAAFVPSLLLPDPSQFAAYNNFNSQNPAVPPKPTNSATPWSQATLPNAPSYDRTIPIDQQSRETQRSNGPGTPNVPGDNGQSSKSPSREKIIPPQNVNRESWAPRAPMSMMAPRFSSVTAFSTKAPLPLLAYTPPTTTPVIKVTTPSQTPLPISEPRPHETSNKYDFVARAPLQTAPKRQTPETRAPFLQRAPVTPKASSKAPSKSTMSTEDFSEAWSEYPYRELHSSNGSPRYVYDPNVAYEYSPPDLEEVQRSLPPPGQPPPLNNPALRRFDSPPKAPGVDPPNMHDFGVWSEPGFREDAVNSAEAETAAPNFGYRDAYSGQRRTRRDVPQRLIKRQVSVSEKLKKIQELRNLLPPAVNHHVKERTQALYHC